MIRQLVGDCRVQLAMLEPESVQCCITSPPYYGLRDYGTEPLVWGGDAECTHCWGGVVGSTGTGRVDQGRPMTAPNAANWSRPEPKMEQSSQGQLCPCGAWLGSLGLEPTPELFIEHLVEVFRGVRRVLRPDGVLWVNLGDSYAGSGKGPNTGNSLANGRGDGTPSDVRQGFIGKKADIPGFKPKDLMMMPARLAMALQADGWWLRSMIPWLKRNSMPESVTDRPATSVEYVFLFSRSRTYYWDAEAIRERAIYGGEQLGIVRGQKRRAHAMGVSPSGNERPGADANIPTNRNRRNSDWFFESWQGLMLDEQDGPLALVVNPQPFKGSHFATFPPKLVEPMIKASTRPGDTVLDPFGGAGTVGLVADRLGRDAILIDLKPGYADMATERLVGDAPMFVELESV